MKNFQGGQEGKPAPFTGLRRSSERHTVLRRLFVGNGAGMRNVRMKSEKKRIEGAFTPAGYLSDIVLLFVNSVGFAGALTEILEIPWKEIGRKDALPGLQPVLFWGVLLLICAAAVLIRSGSSGKKVMIRAAVCAVLYILLGAVFREALFRGLSMALTDAVENLNEYYQFHIAWSDLWLRKGTGWSVGMRTLAMTCGVLYVLFPLEVLAGIFGRYDRGFCLIVGNAMWFTLACACNRFPGFFFLALCVAGAVATLVQKDFRKHPGRGFAVAVCAAALTGLPMAAVYHFFLPALDRQYEEMLERRAEFYRLVNEEWIPEIKSILPAGGFGTGVDVTGELGRKHLFTYTSADMYRVTVDEKPQGAMYLKGFAGGEYGEKEWLAQEDRELEDYYRAQGMELPGNYGELANISYEAAKVLQHHAEPAHIRIEELGGRGSYCIYPYGALLTEDFQVHGDGRVVRKDSIYEFAYYFLSGFGGRSVLDGNLAEEEQNYRQYAYDHFLAYPEEALPRLTAWLKEADIRTDNVYVCAMDLIQLLDRQAVYNLDAGNNPSGTDFVEYFLFDSREGYCMHFASAGVLALRYFGIPARYVTGYTVSPSDFVRDAGGDFTAVLTGRQAHAWAEVYLDTIGWVPVEMTPGAVAFPEDNRLEQLGQVGRLAGQGLMLSENEELWQQDKLTWQNDASDTGEDGEVTTPEGSLADIQVAENGNQHVLGEGTEQVADKTEDMPDADADAGMQQMPGAAGKALPLVNKTEFHIFMGVMAIFMLLGALVCLEKWDESRRRYLFSRADRRERIFLLYRNFRNIFQLAGYGREMDVDGTEFRQILLDLYGVSDAEYAMFCRILEKNSFGKEEPSEEELREVRFLYDRLTKEAYGRAAFYIKPLIRRYQSCV